MSHTRVKTTYRVPGSYGYTEKKELYCHHNHGNDTTTFYDKYGDVQGMVFEQWIYDDDLWDAMYRLMYPYKGAWGEELKDGVEYYFNAPWETKNK